MSEIPSGESRESTLSTPNTDVMRAELQALADQFLDVSDTRDIYISSHYLNRHRGQVDLEQITESDGDQMDLDERFLMATVLDADKEFVAMVKVPKVVGQRGEFCLNPPSGEDGKPVIDPEDIEMATDPELSRIAALLQPAKTKIKE